MQSTDIATYSWILSFLDDCSFRYYLPAYMVWALKNFEVSDSFSIDQTIYSLTLHSDSRDLMTRQLSRFRLFTREQAKAILGFLTFMAEHSQGRADDEAAQAAIAEYWAKRVDADAGG